MTRNVIIYAIRYIEITVVGGIEMIGNMKKIIITVVLIALAAGGCFGLGILFGGRKSEPVISSTTLEQHLVTISELATIKYGYTNMGKFESQSNFYGWTVPFTKKVFIVAYDGEIKAGVDMRKASITVETDKIKIILPPAEILSHSIDDKSIEVFDESKNIFNPISITDYTQFSTDQKEKIEKKAIDGGLLSEAQTRARDAVEKLVFLLGDYDDKSIDIKFE